MVFHQDQHTELLFQCQEEKDKTQRYINSILEWERISNNKNTKNIKNNSIIKIIEDIDMYPIEYNSPFLSPEMNDFSKIIFNDLLNKILVVDQYKRPKINDLSNHSFFTSYEEVTYSIIKCHQNKMSELKLAVYSLWQGNWTKRKGSEYICFWLYACL